MSISKITRYALLSGTESELNHHVNDAIEKGWQPYGTPYQTSVNADGDTWITHHQAIVVYKEAAK